MADSLEKQIDAMLQNGESKQSIFTKFNNPDTRARLIFFLNNKSLISRRHKYMWINLFLGLLLLGMTLKRLLAIADAGHFDFYLLADFIVPTINFYILREIFLFHRTGYQFLIILTGLSLFYVQNRVMPDLLTNTGMIALAAFLYFKLFPRDELLKAPAK
ncbi:MAG TPA: hypothetical protein ENO11_01990 [Desulfobacteraceae bacterium]|nr:hypothetical protein [Desulfobacteraceae bacterium]